MPAINPRISVTVTPEVDALLARLSAISGASKSSIIGDLVVTSVPVLDRMATIIEAAATAKAEMHTQTLENLVAAESKFAELLGSSRQLFDELTLPFAQVSEVLGEAEAAPERTHGRTRQRPPARADSAPRPPLVTRGSGTPENSVNSPMKSTGVEGVLASAEKEAEKEGDFEALGSNAKFSVRPDDVSKKQRPAKALKRPSKASKAGRGE